MDETIFPGSWNLVKKNLPGLLGAGVGAIAGSIAAGRRAYRQVQLDNRSKFPTWSERKMPLKARFVAKRRYPTRRRYPSYKRRSTSQGWRRVVRTSNITNPITSLAAASFNSVVLNPTLSYVQTSDLTSAYRLFRVRKVVLHAFPRVDAANSGLASNFTTIMAAACDPEGTSAPANIQAITAYDNGYAKCVPSGQSFKYTFYPKVVNTVDVSGTATAAGSYGMNPWLQLNATGITIPHRQLVFGIQSGANTTLSVDAFFEVHFDVKGMA